MAKKIRLRYPSAERFIQDFPEMQEGRLFVAGPDMPSDSEIHIEMYVPDLPGMYLVEGRVTGMEERAGRRGIGVEFPRDCAAIQNLQHAASLSDTYRDRLSLDSDPSGPRKTEPGRPDPAPASTVSTGPRPRMVERIRPDEPTRPRPAMSATQPRPAASASPRPSASATQPRPAASASPRPSASATQPRPAAVETSGGVRFGRGGPAREKTPGQLKLEWLTGVVGKEDLPPPREEKTEVFSPAVSEKKELTPEERERVKPVGELTMDLAKAMLRSGYYSPDHPQAKVAKTGLFEELQRALGDCREIMFLNQETREKTDVLISGVLDEPVSVRTVVGAGMAELFVPRLRDFFSRKALVSFAVKRDISLPHFEAFVDVMSDPKVDRGTGENPEVGQLLTRSLAEAGITEISTVFMDDMILFEEALPWRVEMAIQRLAKDLKVLPMYKQVTPEELKALKVRIVEDIVRPLQHPDLLSDIVINCHVIARHVKGIREAELEDTIINAMPARMVLPTSRFIFADLSKLKAAREKQPDNAGLARRHEDVKNVLKRVTQRVVRENTAGAEGFLEQLFRAEVLAFAELPPEVQYRINTLSMANDVVRNFADYDAAIREAIQPEQAMIILRGFRRVLPRLLETGNWNAISSITTAVDKAATQSRVFLGGAGLPANPLIFIFHEHLAAMAGSLDRVKKEDHQSVAQVVSRLGPTGIEIMLKALADSQDRGVRKVAVESLIKTGDMARRRIRQLLDDPAQPWFIQRNALLIIASVAQGEEDLERARKFLRHAEPRLREEALATVTRLMGRNAEPFILAALTDPDPKVVRRALGALVLTQPPGEKAVARVLELIREAPPKERDQAQAHEKKCAALIRTLASLSGLPDPAAVEAQFIELARERGVGKKTGLLGRLRRTVEEEDEPVVALAVLDALARIGGQQSLDFIAAIPEDEGPVFKKAVEARKKISERASSA